MDNNNNIKALKRKRSRKPSEEGAIDNSEGQGPMESIYKPDIWKQITRGILFSQEMKLDEADASLLGPFEVDPTEAPVRPDDVNEIADLAESNFIRTRVSVSQIYGQLKQARCELGEKQAEVDTTQGELNEKQRELESSKSSLNEARKEKLDAEHKVKLLETELHETRKAKHEAEYRSKLAETEASEMTRGKQEAELMAKQAQINEWRLATTEKKLKAAEAENKDLKKQVQALNLQVAEKMGLIKMLEKSGFNKRAT